MPLNPQAKAVLDKIAEMGLPPRHEQTPASARANSATPPDPGPQVAHVEDGKCLDQRGASRCVSTHQKARGHSRC